MREKERERERERENERERGKGVGWVDERELECNITYSSTAGVNKSSTPPKKNIIIIIIIKIINKQILSPDLPQSENIVGGRSCAQAKHEQ